MPSRLFFARGRFLFDGENFFARVVSTVRTNMMRLAHLVAIWTRRQIRANPREMGAAAIAASFRQFSFWLGWHGLENPFRLLWFFFFVE